MTRREVRVRRVYEESRPDDGVRVLVDRVWPRGVRKETADLAEWAKDVAPSTELRRWFGHDRSRFARFRELYHDELAAPGGQAALERLRALAGGGPLTLLTATRDVEHSHATVLVELLGERAES